MEANERTWHREITNTLLWHIEEDRRLRRMRLHAPHLSETEAKAKAGLDTLQLRTICKLVHVGAVSSLKEAAQAFRDSLPPLLEDLGQAEQILHGD